jgi:hypothetical protein
MWITHTVYNLDTLLLELCLHVPLDAQLTLEGCHLLVLAADLLNDGVLDKVAGQVEQKLPHL